MKIKETIFSKIIKHEIKADIIYQDKLVTAFHNINPKAKYHILIVTNKIIPTVNCVTNSDELMLGRLFTVAAKISKELGISKNGYRLIVNCNADAGQEIFHIHMHLLGGNLLKDI
ncbi:HIT domain-containing protein [Candidatus Providencia siddallii]|uniref:Purine nucleoside phosphoramidase n=1 Tax=Candidatus Providencia siddallii TaxID=1715285 RepID=A0ABP1CDY2_9GAMM